MHAFADLIRSDRTSRPPLGRLVYIRTPAFHDGGECGRVPAGSAGHERVVAASLLKEIVENGWARKNISSVMPAIDGLLAEAGSNPGIPKATLTELARQFATAGTAVALAGPIGSTGPRAVETAAAVALLNYVTGRIGQTVDFSRPHALSRAAAEEDLEQRSLVSGTWRHSVRARYQSVYSRPAARKHLQRAGTVVYLGTMMDQDCRNGRLGPAGR